MDWGRSWLAATTAYILSLLAVRGRLGERTWHCVPCFSVHYRGLELAQLGRKLANCTDCRGGRMLLKLFLMARDRPLLFFSIAWPCLIILILMEFVVISLFGLVLRYFNINTSEILFYLAIGLVFLSIAPIIYPLGFLFAEFYFHILFRVLRLNWFRERKLVNALISWADKKHADEKRANIVGE